MDSQVAAIGPEDSTRTTRSSRRIIAKSLIITVATLFFLGFVINLASRTQDAIYPIFSEPGKETATTGQPPVGVAPESDAVRSSAVSEEGTERSTGQIGKATDSRTSGNGGYPSLINGGLPPLGEKIIKNANITVRVKKDGFDSAFNRALTLASGAGGYVAASNVSTGANDLITGTITLRIPSQKFESVIADLRKIGKVRTLDISSSDISQEYVDLKGRLKSLRAQETVYLSFIRKAKTVEESLNLQERLAEIREQIESITGRMKYIDNQVTYSTVQLTLTESSVAGGPKPVEEWGTVSALGRAAHAFVDTVNFAIIAIGFLAPWLIIGGLAYLIYRRMTNFRRRKTEAHTLAA